MNMFTQLLEDTETFLNKKEALEKQKACVNEKKMEALTLAEKIRDTKLEYPSSSSSNPDDAFELLSKANNREVALKNVKAWKERLESLREDEEKGESLDTILDAASSLTLTEKLLTHRWKYYFKTQTRRVFWLGEAKAQTERRVLSWLYGHDMEFEVLTITREKQDVLIKMTPGVLVASVAGLGIIVGLLRRFCYRKT
jgi:hypothetical protein